jgi:hypothetical protein
LSSLVLVVLVVVLVAVLVVLLVFPFEVLLVASLTLIFGLSNIMLVPVLSFVLHRSATNVQSHPL